MASKDSVWGGILEARDCLEQTCSSGTSHCFVHKSKQAVRAFSESAVDIRLRLRFNRLFVTFLLLC